MSDFQFEPWSDNPNAPKIWYGVYLAEKITFAGSFIESILYGMLVVLFFKCMVALFSPVHRSGEGIKWGLVSFTVVMFSLGTVHTALDLNFLSVSYVDNREFPGVEGMYVPGPMGYQGTVSLKPINVVPYATFPVNSWLADGLLLYRCYVVYSMNLWVIAFPCLMYLASVVIGILAVCIPIIKDQGIESWPTLPYLSTSLSLNIILTLMIVVRLILHGKNVRAAMGPPGGISGLYKTIATMLIESSALFAVSSLLVIGSLGAKSPLSGLFIPILAQTQVIAPLLIIQRVASKKALTKNYITPGSTSKFKPRNQWESIGGSGTLPGVNPMSSDVGEGEVNSSGELVYGVKTGAVIGFRRDRV